MARSKRGHVVVQPRRSHPSAHPRTNSPSADPRSPGVGKKLAFAISTALAILMSVELILWACGVKPAYFRRDPYAGFTPQVRHFQDETDPGGGQVVTVVPSKRETLNE